MSWWVMEQVSVNEAGTQTLANIQCDDVTDLPAPNQSATLGYVIVRGSQAKVLATSENYILGSTGTWVKMEDGVKLDLAGYATTQELNDGLAAKVDNTTYTAGQAAQDSRINYAINTGSKNKFNIAAQGAIDYHTTHTIAGDTITVTGDAGFSRYVVPVSLKAGSYIFTANVVSISTSGRIRFNTASDGTGTNITSQIDFSQAGNVSRNFTLAQDTSFYVMIYSSTSSADSSSNLVISQCMIRSAEITDYTFVPYAPTNRELYEMILALQ